MNKNRPILLVEDDPNDVILFQQAFADAGIRHAIHPVRSAVDAVNYLAQSGDSSPSPLPFLVLLDLKLQGEDGFHVLRWLHARPGLRRQLIVIAWSTASPDSEIQLAYELGVQSFLLKPHSYNELLNIVRRIKEYWIDVNQLSGDTRPVR